jgi:Cu+-exporting ATPase
MEIRKADKKSKSCLLVGDPDLMNEHSVVISKDSMAIADGFRAGGKVAVFVAFDGILKAILAVSDIVRKEASQVIRMLESAGIACYMITGETRDIS